MAKELTFFEKVKAKLRSRDGYQDFLKCLNLYAQEVISKQELIDLVHDLIGRFSDLAVRLALSFCLAPCAAVTVMGCGGMARPSEVAHMCCIPLFCIAEHQQAALSIFYRLQIVHCGLLHCSMSLLGRGPGVVQRPLSI